MKRIGMMSIYLTGSRKTIERVVVSDGEKFFITWYGQLIEVKQGTHRFYTVLDY